MSGITIALIVAALLIIPIGAIMLLFRMQNSKKISQKHAESGEAHSIFTKKYGEVDVNKYRGVFLRVGYAVILAILLFHRSTQAGRWWYRV